MAGTIERLQISELHGYRNYDITISDNTMILVGENGAGKTTVLRILYYILSSQWTMLIHYKFKNIVVTINKKDHTIEHSMLSKYIDKFSKKFERRLPLSVRQKFSEIIRQADKPFTFEEIQKLSDSLHIPMRFVINEFDQYRLSLVDEVDVSNVFLAIKRSLNTKILYLPTYRRIEQELNLIFKDVDNMERHTNQEYLRTQQKDQSFVELIEFGMKDVDKEINKVLEELKDFARQDLNELTIGYLGDVVDKEYSNVRIDDIQNATDETIENVLNRIHEKILSKSKKDHLFERIKDVRNKGMLDDHDRVICHYFLKLLKFQEELSKKESQMTNFCRVCNQYMKDKKFIYNGVEFTFSIHVVAAKKDNMNIELRHLSSGEKQIVSLFSHLYLSGQNKCFVLIDEPELSLSVPWQRRFLPDIKNGNLCSGLVAVTHSPFIYDNDLRPYTHGLGEFFA